MLPIVLVATVYLYSIVSNITLLKVYLLNVLLEYIEWLLGNVYCSDLPKYVCIMLVYLMQVYSNNYMHMLRIDSAFLHYRVWKKLRMDTDFHLLPVVPELYTD